MLGRDCRENGHVEYQKPEAKQPPRRARSISRSCSPMADDPDAGVRRELILAFRNLPTDKVGDALRKLAASWDGQDRWYLEALGLALEKRESGLPVQALRRHALRRPRPRAIGQGTARSRCRRISRSTATRRISRPARPTCRRLPSSKYLGLAWRLHRREVLPLLERVVPYLRTPELQQAGRRHPGADEGAGDGGAGGRRWRRETSDPVHRRELYAMLARRLAGDWNAAREPAAGDSG